jgi:hypothetical protein
MYRTEHGTICLKNEPESFREFFEEIGPFPKEGRPMILIADSPKIIIDYRTRAALLKFMMSLPYSFGPPNILPPILFVEKKYFYQLRQSHPDWLGIFCDIQGKVFANIDYFRHPQFAGKDCRPELVHEMNHAKILGSCIAKIEPNDKEKFHQFRRRYLFKHRPVALEEAAACSHALYAVGKYDHRSKEPWKSQGAMAHQVWEVYKQRVKQESFTPIWQLSREHFASVSQGTTPPMEHPHYIDAIGFGFLMIDFFSKNPGFLNGTFKVDAHEVLIHMLVDYYLSSFQRFKDNKSSISFGEYFEQRFGTEWNSLCEQIYKHADWN